MILNNYSYVQNFVVTAICAFFVHGASCVKQNSIPTYVAINNFSLSTKTSEGSNAQKITDAWVFINGVSNGVFPLPTTFPILDTGSIDLEIFPGVRGDGIKSNPIIYPFYTSYKTKLTASSEKTFTLKPSINYNSSAQIGINEDFERTNVLSVNRDLITNVPFTIINNGFEGKSAQAILDGANLTIEKCTSVRVPIAQNVNNAFIELNYKTSALLYVGLVASDAAYSDVSSVYKIALYPNTEWNKTYISVIDEVHGLNKAYYQIAIKSVKPDSLDKATILIDNLKLIIN